MNIFFLNLDPKKCAQMHLDKHVVKMILESVQLLCSAHHIHPNSNYIPPYKLTHKNHPCSIWVRKSLSNYLWLVKLTRELCIEYTFRYNKKHKCEEYLDDLENNVPLIEDIGLTVPAMAMPDTYKSKLSETFDDNIEAVIDAYKQYYFFEKNYILSWKKREIPDFIQEYKLLFES
jgi:hypothetical protein